MSLHQETHLNPGDKLKLVNYITYRTDRLTHHSGGTSLLIRNSVDHYPTSIASDSFENTTIAIILPNSQQITVSSIYRPPHGIISTDELNRIFDSNTKCIAIGDFNAKHSAWSLGRCNQNGNIINDYRVYSRTTVWVGSVSPFDRGTLMAFTRPKEGV
ncbi:hypothetical protein AVEN_172138-1 [Araneus ventricosus]|uniref:Endonuclease/exonuclease/phosphatase domain-containing protein n=1 Tax=Araneus ventricosus TaxID=182803 RepID=A0A4Y2K1G0_ARAVE|nr:hypothetical protein AVEN_172138-1 [Araneus ventricosus]